MSYNLLQMSQLGAVESAVTVTFGVWLPWVSAADGNQVSVRIIHERDQFLQNVPTREVPMAHAVLPPHGDYWNVAVPIAGTSPVVPGSAWGQPGRYLYRYCVRNPHAGTLDWVIDPYAREFGLGKQSAFTLGYQPHVWSAGEAAWRTPALEDLVVYELNIAEFGGDLERTAELLPYLHDLGVNAIEVMPLSNVGASVDWGYLPIGYFGVDERFGNRSKFQAFVERAHENGLAVLVDVVYGHAGVDFPYYDLYARLGYHENPFMGPFAKDLFGDFGKSTDFRRALTRDYFFTVNQHWLHVFHVDGFRYDCVPNYWDGPLGVGYAGLVYETYQLAKQKVAAADPNWMRFAAAAGPLRLIQCAEQLEGPVEILETTYSNCTWQNGTFDAARAVAGGDRARLSSLGLRLGLFGYPTEQTTNGERIPKTALQYIENHDHERFVCNFGLLNPDDAKSPLFEEGDRRRWYKVQPYLIALLLARGVPLLWEGEELCENYFLPEFGSGRVFLLRALRWDYFYDEYGRGTIRLVRELLRLRRDQEQFRRGEYHFFDHWDRYQSKGLLLFARWTSLRYSLVAVNTSDADATVPFWFPIGGTYREELHGGTLDLAGVVALEETQLGVPSNYGRVWTSV